MVPTDKALDTTQTLWVLFRLLRLLQSRALPFRSLCEGRRLQGKGGGARGGLCSQTAPHFALPNAGPLALGREGRRRRARAPLPLQQACCPEHLLVPWATLRLSFPSFPASQERHDPTSPLPAHTLSPHHHLRGAHSPCLQIRTILWGIGSLKWLKTRHPECLLDLRGVAV